MAADHGERQRVADADDQHRDGVAGDDDEEEVGERCGVGRVARPALRRSWLVDDVRQRTDGQRTGGGRPQPRTCQCMPTDLKFVHTGCGALRCVMCRANQIRESNGSVHTGLVAVRFGTTSCGLLRHFRRMPQDATQCNAPHRIHCERTFSLYSNNSPYQ